MKIQITISERVLLIAGLSVKSKSYGDLMIAKNVAGVYSFLATTDEVLALVEGLEGCPAFNGASKLNYVRDPDVESDTYTVRIAAAMIRRALQNPRPA